ncbi:MAG: DUF58 domain-containing protein [Nitrospiraceae bacterium]|nr:DUF58 domain-containing protein [Nitrospiraceae bacterium]
MKNMFWFMAAGVALATAFLAHSPYMAFAIYAFLLLAMLAHFSSLAWLAGLDCERTVSDTILRQGETTQVSVKITNQRGWPIPWIFFEDKTPPGFNRTGDNTRLAVLMPGRSVTLKYSLLCPRRGYHRIGPLLMESGDLFGLQKRFRTGEQQEYVAVLPTVAYIDTFNVAARRPQGPVRISNRIYEDPTRVMGAREYVPGDPLNRIHWKASARTGTLFSKIQEPSSVLGGTLLLDLHETGYGTENAESRMELAITTTASIGYLLQMSGEQVGLLTNARDAAEVARYEVESQHNLSRGDAEDSIVDDDEFTRLSPVQVPTIRSTIQAQKIIENLARVLPTTGLTLDQLIWGESLRLPRDAALLPIVPRVSEHLALTLASMKQSGFNVTVFLIDNSTEYEHAAGLLAQHEIYTFHIEHERDLHEISPARIGQ